MYNVSLDNVTNTTTMTNITYTGLTPMTIHLVTVVPYNNAGAATPTSVNVTTLIPSG